MVLRFTHDYYASIYATFLSPANKYSAVCQLAKGCPLTQGDENEAEWVCRRPRIRALCRPQLLECSIDIKSGTLLLSSANSQQLHVRSKVFIPSQASQAPQADVRGQEMSLRKTIAGKGLAGLTGHTFAAVDTRPCSTCGEDRLLCHFLNS